jgi:ribonuclease BN (tRNA processing enzyme)
MEFNIKAIGTGSAFTKTQCHTSLLLEVNGKRYLFDCGFKVPQALHEMGISLDTIDGIVISHIHADHTGGLEEVGFMGKYLLNKKFDLFIAEDLVSPLWDNTLSGGMYELGGGEFGSLDMFFNVHTFEHDKIASLNGLEVKAVKTIHVNTSKPSYSFILDNKVFFSADLLFDELLLNKMYYDGVKTFFHDCQLFHYEGQVHASLQELSTLPEEIRHNVKALHYGDNYADFEDKFKEVGITRVKQGDIFKF